MEKRKHTSLRKTNFNVINLIQGHREKKGYSQRQLSDLLNKNPMYIHLVEKDRAAIPLEMVNTLCAILDIRVYDYCHAYLDDRLKDFHSVVFKHKKGPK